jgi:hypothetical protein
LRGALLLGALASTPAWAIDTPSSTVLGFTAAGDFFVYTVGFDEQPPDEWYVVSVRTGKQTAFSKKEEYAAWVAKHPMPGEDAAAPASGRKSPDGKTEVVLQAKGGKWTESDWSTDDEKAPSCSMKTPAGTLPCVSFSYRTGAGVSPYWAPSSARVVWFSSYRSCAPTGTGDYTCDQDWNARVDRTAGPSVQMLAKDLPDSVLEKVSAAVEKAGFVTTNADTAKAAREKSVVYASKTAMDAAKKIATAVPGGATVEALSWKTPYDVVIAVGASAK